MTELRIGKPYIRREEERMFLCAQITRGNQTQEVWFSVESQYEEYLTDDRADAFVIAFLTTAMRRGESIICEAPVTRRLLYQLRQYLIPAMSANMESYHAIQITAQPAEHMLTCGNAVGTGWTGGVDRFYHEKENYIAHVFAGKQNRHCREVLRELDENGIAISDWAYNKAKMLRAAVNASEKMNDRQRKSLSVIIPAYRAEKYLAEAVESVRRQKLLKQTEIIVVDDGSDDHTAEIAEKLKVTLLRKEHGGAASARNAGLKIASGSLILFLDADDVLCPDAFSELLGILLNDAEIAAVFAMAEDFISTDPTEGQINEELLKEGFVPELDEYSEIHDLISVC